MEHSERVWNLFEIDAVVDGPHGLEVVPHAVLQLPREVVDAEEILEVLGLAVEGRSPGVHPLDDGGHVTEHGGVHDGWGGGGGPING